jgi:hypothetical protein
MLEICTENGPNKAKARDVMHLTIQLPCPNRNISDQSHDMGKHIVGNRGLLTSSAASASLRCLAQSSSKVGSFCMNSSADEHDCVIKTN